MTTQPLTQLFLIAPLANGAFIMRECTLTEVEQFCDLSITGTYFTLTFVSTQDGKRMYFMVIIPEACVDLNVALEMIDEYMQMSADGESGTHFSDRNLYSGKNYLN